MHQNRGFLDAALPRISIVLANLMSRSGVLNSETKARLELAARLEVNQPSHLLLLCGWDYRPDSGIAIADAMKSYLTACYPKLSAKAVCQRLSRDTVGDALFSRIFLDLVYQHRPLRITVVTSDYHIERSREIFEFIFGEQHIVSVFGSPGFSTASAVGGEGDSLMAFRNTFGGVVPGDVPAALHSLSERHPFYNGRIFSKIGDIDEICAQLSLDRLAV